MTDSDTTIPGKTPDGHHWSGVPVGGESAPDRRVLASAAVAAVGFVALDGAWVGIQALGQDRVAPAVVIVMAVLIGAAGAAVAPSRVGWVGLFAGATAAAIVTTVVALLFTRLDGWAILALFAAVAWNCVLTAIFGTVGFAYWVISGPFLRRRVAAAALVRDALLAVIGSGLFVAVLLWSPRPPLAAIAASNDTQLALQIGEVVDGSWRPVPGVTATVRAREARLLLIDPKDPAATGVGAILGPDGCTTRELVARGPDGTEVARHGPGLCGDETWEISTATPIPSG